ARSARGQRGGRARPRARPGGDGLRRRASPRRVVVPRLGARLAAAEPRCPHRRAARREPQHRAARHHHRGGEPRLPGGDAARRRDRYAARVCAAGARAHGAHARDSDDLRRGGGRAVGTGRECSVSDLVLTEEQQLLQSSAADFAKNLPVSRVRALRDAGDPLGFSLETWRSMAELGWPGILLPEEYGGLGLGYAELAVVLEELGKVLAPEPFLSTVLLAGNAILLGGSDAQKKELLPRVASGDLVLAFAHHEPGARHDPYRVETRAEAQGGGFRLTGVKDIVLDGAAAERLVVSARSSGQSGERDGLSLFLVDPRASGVTVTRQQLVDHRNAARVRLDGVEVPSSALIGELGKGADVLDPVLDRAV